VDEDDQSDQPKK
jgi:hypothetical protein